MNRLVKQICCLIAEADGNEHMAWVFEPEVRVAITAVLDAIEDPTEYLPEDFDVRPFNNGQEMFSEIIRIIKTRVETAEYDA